MKDCFHMTYIITAMHSLFIIVWSKCLLFFCLYEDLFCFSLEVLGMNISMVVHVKLFLKRCMNEFYILPFDRRLSEIIWVCFYEEHK